jgi:hypothetical protein
VRQLSGRRKLFVLFAVSCFGSLFIRPDVKLSRPQYGFTASSGLYGARVVVLLSFWNTVSTVRNRRPSLLNGVRVWIWCSVLLAFRVRLLSSWSLCRRTSLHRFALRLHSAYHHQRRLHKTLLARMFPAFLLSEIPPLFYFLPTRTLSPQQAACALGGVAAAIALSVMNSGDPASSSSAANPPYSSGAVAAEAGLCSDLGVEMLRRNGSAVDAAVAAVLCVGVVNPQSSGIGGGGFMVVHDAGESIVYDFRETAPSASDVLMCVRKFEQTVLLNRVFVGDLLILLKPALRCCFMLSSGRLTRAAIDHLSAPNTTFFAVFVCCWVCGWLCWKCVSCGCWLRLCAV